MESRGGGYFRVHTWTETSIRWRKQNGVVYQKYLAIKEGWPWKKSHDEFCCNKMTICVVEHKYFNSQLLFHKLAWWTAQMVNILDSSVLAVIYGCKSEREREQFKGHCHNEAS